MTDQDAFDRRLADSLRRYSADRPTLSDPRAFALSIALNHPRRSPWSAVIVRRGSRWIAMILVGVLLIVAALLALAGTGALQMPVAPRQPMPDELFGEYQATVIAVAPRVAVGVYTFDVNGPSLLRGATGDALRWAGVADSIVQTPSGGVDLVVRAAGSCGNARYAIVVGDDGRDVSPGPSASQGGFEPTPGPSRSALQSIGDGEPIRFVPIADECPDRVSILTAGPWAHPVVQLVAGSRYRSMSFTEPFEFTMPGGDPSVPPAVARFWGKGVFRVGNGYSWTSFFVDDVPVAADVCDVGSGVLADVPATPEDVGAWLRGARGITVTEERDVVIDGRTAKSFSIRIHGDDSCGLWTSPLGPGEFYFGFRVYAIPTGDDTILYLPWSDGGSFPDTQRTSDELVRSMTFD
jgi:hypothetical protein